MSENCWFNRIRDEAKRDSKTHLGCWDEVAGGDGDATGGDRLNRAALQGVRDLDRR